jgi:tRNA (mo5U34)-methyltransferase
VLIKCATERYEIEYFIYQSRAFGPEKPKGRRDMHMSEIIAAAPEFRARLGAARESVKDLCWYPYTSLDNVTLLEQFLPHELELVPNGGSVLDVGAADGDMGYLFQSLGCRVDFLDNVATNFNDCEGLKRTASLLAKPVSLIECDMDWGFELDREYDLVIFLGTLYHLRNPALVLIRLAQRCQRALISTRVTSHLPDGQNVERTALAYFLENREANDDSTNYWIFTPAGLERILKRCGWRVIHSTRFGQVGRSNPVDNSADERMFAFCERVGDYADLDKHHDF